MTGHVFLLSKHGPGNCTQKVHRDECVCADVLCGSGYVETDLRLLRSLACV